jgi:exodeoxyribonuclease VII small subunit
MASQDEQPTFEQAFNELRETVQALESGNLALEEATKLFDKGMKLAKVCGDLLSATELQVSRLQRSFGEQMPMADPHGSFGLDTPSEPEEPEDSEEDEA